MSNKINPPGYKHLKEQEVFSQPDEKLVLVRAAITNTADWVA